MYEKFPIRDIDIEIDFESQILARSMHFLDQCNLGFILEMVLSNSVDTVKYLLWVEMLSRKLFSRLVVK